MCGRYYVDDDTAREIEKVVREVDEKLSILVICQELFLKDFDVFFRKKGNFNRPTAYSLKKDVS